jgi:hypothetical protein
MDEHGDLTKKNDDLIGFCWDMMGIMLVKE